MIIIIVKDFKNLFKKSLYFYSNCFLKFMGVPKMTNSKSGLFMNTVFLTSVKLRVVFFAMFAFVFFSSFAVASNTVYRLNATIANADTLDNVLGAQSISGLCNNLTSNVRLELSSQALLSQVAPNDDNSKTDGEEEILITPEKLKGKFVPLFFVGTLFLTPINFILIWLLYRKKLSYTMMIVLSILLSAIFIILGLYDVLYLNKTLLTKISLPFAGLIVIGSYLLPDKEPQKPVKKSKAPDLEQPKE